jgi:hypothetical protein
MNPEQPQRYDDEISLTDIIRSLWDGKWIIIGITAVTSILAVIYLTYTPKIYEGTLEIFPISTFETSKYEELNNSKLIKMHQRYKSTDRFTEELKQKLLSSNDSSIRTNISIDMNQTPIEEDNVTINNGFINAEKLELLFVQDLLTYKGFEASIMGNMYVKKTKDETELDFLDRVKKAAREFTFSKLEHKRSNDVFKQRAKLILSVTTLQPDLALKVISDALVVSNNNVGMQVEKDINRILESLSGNILNELEDIKISSKILLNKEKLKTQARLVFLEEQSAIARSLDIDKNTLSTQTFTTESKQLAAIYRGEQPYYLRGYVAIEKEIETLSTRKSPQYFIDTVINNEVRKETLLQDQTIPRAKKIISSTPIGTDKFKSVLYDIASINFKTLTNSIRILALSIFLGGMIGLLVLLIRNVVIRKE